MGDLVTLVSRIGLLGAQNAAKQGHLSSLFAISPNNLPMFAFSQSIFFHLGRRPAARRRGTAPVRKARFGLSGLVGGGGVLGDQDVFWLVFECFFVVFPQVFSVFPCFS